MIRQDGWTPQTWRSRPITQQPCYSEPELLRNVTAELGRLPPLVTSFEIERLKGLLARAQEGGALLLQGGDCAETFAECRSETIARKLKILLQMSVILLHGLKMPIVRVGRFAGQYAKPRSDNVELRDGVTLPSYRGDMVNDAEFTARARQPDPRRLLQAYHDSALTLNFIRSLVAGGFTDIRHPEYWDLDFVRHSPQRRQYERIVRSISDALDFAEALSESRPFGSDAADFYTSHELLLLEYEAAQTRFIERRESWYDLTTHFPWIGMRTADPDFAHVEFCRGIANPIAVKIGPSMSEDALERLITILNPDNLPGRLTLIHRLGADRIEAMLPRFIEVVRRLRARVLWSCDPMHGNTEKTASGLKTRRFDNILAEVEQAFAIHAQMGSQLGGLHVEVTGDDVTECVGGARGLAEHDLARAYRSQVDPRLNCEQALELALRVVASRHAGAHARRRVPRAVSRTDSVFASDYLDDAAVGR
jgi:3-deoxy-7-phosphoheptulonate synthase